MSLLLPLAGFLGAWLLVAGPVFQAAVELEEQGGQMDHEGFAAVQQSVPRQERLAPAWWLLPPVAFLKQRSQTRRYRAAVVEAMSVEQVEQFVHFTDKATGWALVGTGGLLLALGETRELVEALDWPAWAFWPVAVVAFLLSALYTVGRMRRSHGLMQQKRPEARAG